MTEDKDSPNQPTAGRSPVPASVIAIDGPVASGKTAVGLALSRELGYRLVDTGMMYRAVTWLALRRGIAVLAEDAVAALAQDAKIELGPPNEKGNPTLSIDGVDITDELRSPDVDRNVSFVSRILAVRQAMVIRQRELAEEGRLIMLGRDIGTVVLPGAPVKIYLDASAKERARRRHLELRAAGVDRPESEIREELEQRDAMDLHRAVSPLMAADDALTIDTDHLSLAEVIDRVRAAATSR